MRVKEHYDWSDFTDATFVELHSGQSSDTIVAALEPYRELQNKSDTKWPIQ